LPQASLGLPAAAGIYQTQKSLPNESEDSESSSFKSARRNLQGFQKFKGLLMDVHSNFNSF
jgi:hypothetical protein